MTFDEWKKQYRVQMPDDLKEKVYQALDEHGDPVGRLTRRAPLTWMKSVATVAACIVIAGGVYSYVNVNTHSNSNLGAWNGTFHTHTPPNRDFVKFQLSVNQKHLIQSALGKLGMNKGKLGDQGVTLYVPTFVPKGTSLQENQIQVTHGYVNIGYGLFNVICSSNSASINWTKIGTVEIQGVHATWYKYIPQQEAYSTRKFVASPQYVLDFTLNHTQISIMSDLKDISKGDIEKTAEHLYPTKIS